MTEKNKPEQVKLPKTEVHKHETAVGIKTTPEFEKKGLAVAMSESNIETPCSSKQKIDPELKDLPQPKATTPNTQLEECDCAVGTTDVEAVVDDDFCEYGWVPFHRKYFDEWWWDRKPWSHAQLFLYLLSEAQVKPKRKNFGGTIITLQRGYLWITEEKLADKIGWSRSKLQNVLKLFESAGDIKTVMSGKAGKILQICHYEKRLQCKADKRQKRGQK